MLSVQFANRTESTAVYSTEPHLPCGSARRESRVPRLRIRDCDIVYDDVPPAATTAAGTLLLVHGHPFDRTMWRPQLPAAADAGWRVVAPDLRGYGGSDVTPGVVTLEAFADDLAALLDALDIEHAVVGGLSMGGQIVMAMCQRHPARIRGVLLAATFARVDTAEVRASRFATADRITEHGITPVADDVLPRMLAPASCVAQPTLRATVHGMMRAAPPLGAAAALRGRADRQAYESVLSTVHEPASIVVGDQDAFTTRADVEAMQSRLPDVEVVWMPGVGHMPNLEQSDRFNQAMLRLLAASQRGTWARDLPAREDSSRTSPFPP